jgi:hypothetical protein
MAELKVELRSIPCDAAPDGALFITIDGRQALEEGPRRVGMCIYCAGPCQGVTVNCETRVWLERQKQ